jgi:hypothetical protein
MRPNHCFRHSLFATLILGLMVAVSGCSGDNPSYAPDPRPGGEASPGEPLFASDKEALEAAADAYRAYFLVADLILAEGGTEPERLIDLVSPEIFEVQLESYEQFAAQNYRSIGATTVDTVTLQQHNPRGAPGQALVTIYACVDISSSDVFDEDGSSVLTFGRQDRYAYEASFSTQLGGTLPLILSEEDRWTGSDFCI